MNRPCRTPTTCAGGSAGQASFLAGHFFQAKAQEVAGVFVTQYCLPATAVLCPGFPPGRDHMKHEGALNPERREGALMTPKRAT